MVYKNGIKYDGEWDFREVRHGQGSLQYPVGTKVEGTWANNRLSGLVTIVRRQGRAR